MANKVYRLIVKNSKVVMKLATDALIYIFGIKDVSGTGNVSNGIVDWSIQHKTKTTAQWNADSTTVLLLGQLGIEDTGTDTFKLKIGDGVSLWSALGYAGGGSGGVATWGTIIGTLSDQTDLQNALNAKANQTDLNTEITNRTDADTALQLDIDTHEARTDNPHNVTKTQVGLGNVPNVDATNPANITQSASYRFATDAEKAAWNAVIGGSVFQSVWNATTNSPTLVSGTGTKGHYYIVNVAGSTNLDGITDWKVGDWAIFDGTVWRKVDNTDAVSSVNGLTGAVVLDTSNVSDTSNKRYVTDANLTTIGNQSGTNTGDETAARIGAIVNGAANYATPLDNDKFGIWDSLNSMFKYVTWANIKATIKTYFDTIYTTVSAVSTQIIEARPVGYWYSDSSVVAAPGDASVYYSGTVNNYTVELANTYSFQSPKANAVFKVTVNVFVRGTLATTETTTVKIQNLTAATEETLNSVTHNRRQNSSHSTSTLASALNNEMIIQLTNPSWATNPTTVHYQFIITAY